MCHSAMAPNSAWPRTEQDGCSADQAYHRSHDIPAIRFQALGEPQPEQRGNHVDSSVCRVGAAGVLGVNESEQIGEQANGSDAGNQLPRRLVEPQLRPESKAAGNLCEGGTDVSDSCPVADFAPIVVHGNMPD